MSGDFGSFGEAAGDIVTGGLAARAVEPGVGEADGHMQEGACLNCGTPLAGPHCHECGQRAHVHRTLGAFFHDLLHGVLHFEGKTWRTLPMLAWKPGQLTREYIEGKRAKYISPIALFLFVVFVSFALWNALGGVGEVELDPQPVSREQVDASLEAIDEDIADLELRIAQARRDGDETQLPSLESELESNRKARRIAGELSETFAGTSPTVTVGSGTTEVEKGLADWIDAKWKKAKANPGLLVYKMQTNAYKLSWLLIPLSLPFMWLLFPFSRRFRMYDHTVFVTYSIAFMTILVVVASLGGYLQWKPLIIAPLLYAPVHLFRQLRGAYQLSAFGAFWRLILLSLLIYLVLLLFALIMIGMVL